MVLPVGLTNGRISHEACQGFGARAPGDDPGRHQGQAGPPVQEVWHVTVSLPSRSCSDKVCMDLINFSDASF